MATLLAIFQVIRAIPTILAQLGSLIRTWRDFTADKKKENSNEAIDKEHNDLRDGTTPRRD